MTVLPRTPVDTPVNPLQAQHAATGKAAANRAQQPGGADTEGGALPSFSALLGKMLPPVKAGQNGAHEAAPLPVELQPAETAADAVLDQVANLAGEEIAPLSVPPISSAVSGSIEARPSGTVEVQQAQPAAGALPSAIHSGAVTAETKGPHSQLEAVSPRAQESSNIALAAGRGGVAVEGDVESQPARLGDALTTGAPGKTEQSAVARSDLASLRIDAGVSERDKVLPRTRSASSPAVPAAAAQPAAEAAPERIQIKPAAANAELAPTPVQPSDPINLNQSAASNNATQVTGGGSDELPRLQDVKVTSSRVIEMAPVASDRTGQGTSVKVIDLQLQPDTLGRIGAQLKRTGEGLEIRLEPSLAETALLLKEDRLALQRILGALGPLTEQTLVRIVEPVAEQRQTDGQEQVAGFELGEAEHGGTYSAASEDLRREGAWRNDPQAGQQDADENSADARRVRASDDIYI